MEISTAIGEENKKTFSGLDKIILGSIVIGEYAAVAGIFFPENGYLLPISIAGAFIGSKYLLQSFVKELKSEALYNRQ